jgi:hypothetical protein
MSNSEDKKEIANLRLQIESYRDFIDWLFDNPDDEGIHWMSESEAWKLFQKWQTNNSETHD